MPHGMRFVRFERLRGSCAVSSDVLLYMKPDGKKAVHLGKGAALLCKTTDVLNTRHSLCIQYVANLRDDWPSQVNRPMVVHVGE